MDRKYDRVGLEGAGSAWNKLAERSGPDGWTLNRSQVCRQRHAIGRWTVLSVYDGICPLPDRCLSSVAENAEFQYDNATSSVPRPRAFWRHTHDTSTSDATRISAKNVTISHLNIVECWLLPGLYSWVREWGYPILRGLSHWIILNGSCNF
jgi:hypothetical protein